VSWPILLASDSERERERERAICGIKRLPDARYDFFAATNFERTSSITRSFIAFANRDDSPSLNIASASIDANYQAMREISSHRPCCNRGYRFSIMPPSLDSSRDRRSSSDFHRGISGHLDNASRVFSLVYSKRPPIETDHFSRSSSGLLPLCSLIALAISVCRCDRVYQACSRAAPASRPRRARAHARGKEMTEMRENDTRLVQSSEFIRSRFV
jgi:hypothetical protein